MIWRFAVLAGVFGGFCVLLVVLEWLLDQIETLYRLVADLRSRRDAPTMGGPWPVDPRVQVWPVRPVLYDQDAEVTP